MQTTIKQNRASLLGMAVFILALVALPNAHAGNNWDGGGVYGFWNTANNWDNDTVPASAQNLTFSGGLQTTTSNDFSANFIVGTGVASTFAITFANNSTNATSGFTLAGSSIVLGGDISTAASGSAITDTISLAMQLSGNRTINTSTNHNLIISGLISQNSGNRQLVKAGTGELILRNAGNNYLGSTSVNAGTLTIDVAGGIQNAGSASALGAGTASANSQIIFSGGTLNVTLGAGSTDRQVRIGSATATSTAGANINNNSANGSNPLLFTSAAFNNTTDSGMSVVTALRTLSLGGANTDANAINGVIADHNTAGGGIVRVTKADTGRWILSGANTYSGGTTLTAGTLQISRDSAGTVGAVTSGAVGTGTLTLNAGTLSSSSTTGRVLLNAVTVGGNVTLGDGANSGLLSFNAATDLGGATRTLTTASDVIFNGIVSNGGINKAGAGTLLLTAANSYTGATTISAGTLQLGDGTTGKDGTVASSSIVNNSSLLFNRFGSSSYGGVISGSGNVTKSGAGTQTLSGANTYSGATTISAGTLQLGDGTTGKDGTVASTSIVNNGSLVFNRFGSSSYGGVISGNGNVTKSGEGTQALSGANTYTGTTTLNAGTLQLGANGVGAVGAVTNGPVGTGTLALNGGKLSSAGGSSRTLYNAVTMGGNVTLGDATNTGTLIFSAGVDLGGNGRTLTTASNVNITGAVSNGSIIKDGSGILSLGGVNTYNGITISGGTVSITGASVLGTGTITFNGGSISAGTSVNRSIANLVNFTGNAGFGGDGAGALTFSANADLGGVTRTLTTAVDTTFSGVISNGGINKAGASTLTLSGANTYTGNTTISAGVLQVGNARALQDSTLDTTSSFLGDASNGLRITPTTLTLGGLAGNKDLASVFTTTSGGYTGLTALTLKSGDGLLNSYSGRIADGATGMTLTKTGAGTQALSGANTYSGLTTINEGTLTVAGSITSSSVVNGGLLNVNGTAGGVIVNTGGSLGGSGNVGAISGSGTVGPGNSPGILTALSVDPTAGTGFKFEFSSLNPTYNSATASGNDLLHLTASSSPFAGGAFTSGNIVSIYLNSSSITDSLLAGLNTTFSGGFFVDGTYNLASALSPATFAYYTTSAALGTGSAVDYNGTSYYLLNSSIAAKTTLSDTAVTNAGFATGAASGTLLTFNAVPEPSTGALLGFGLGGLVLTRLLRRKHS